MRSMFLLRVGLGVVVGAGIGMAVLLGTDPVYAASASVLARGDADGVPLS